MKFENEDNKPEYTKEAFLAEFNRSLGAAKATNIFKNGGSVYYNDLVGDDYVIV